MKPVGAARLRQAVERARNTVGRPLEIANQVARIAAAGDTARQGQRRKVVGRSGADYFLVDADEILAFQADRALVWMITEKRRLLATHSLRVIQERLGGDRFQRVHRNAIVNVDHVRKMSALSSQRWLVTLSNSLQLTVSKRQAYNIRRILQW
jgi:DNA-binding LytR/AlgR family response regulator